nr:hypothetical protein [Tanacetum cinerariifolium]
SDDKLEALDAAPQSPRQAPPSPDYVPGPEHPPLPNYVPGPEEPEQASLSPDYEDSEDDDKEEEEHLALADSSDVPVDDLVPSAEDTEAFETDDSAPIPSPRRHTARMSVRP